MLRLGRLVYGRLLFSTQIFVFAVRLCLKRDFRHIAHQSRQSSIATTSLRSALGFCRRSSPAVASSIICHDSAFSHHWGRWRLLRYSTSGVFSVSMPYSLRMRRASLRKRRPCPKMPSYHRRSIFLYRDGLQFRFLSSPARIKIHNEVFRRGHLVVSP